MEKGLETLSLSMEQRQNAIIGQLEELDLQKKDQDLAFRLEFVGGLFGLLGLGYIYSGLIGAGVVRLLAYWIALSIIWGLFYTMSQMLGLVSLFVLPLIFHLAIAFLSAKDLKESFFFAREAQLTDAEADDDFIGYLEAATDNM